MISRRSVLLSLSCALVSRPMMAAAKDLRVDMEVTYLVNTVETSPCKFKRNGTWYDGAQAAAHLREKYRWMQRFGQISSAEDFVVKVATKSSASGIPYALRCPGQDDIESAAWLYRALTAFRRASARGDAGPRP